MAKIIELDYEFHPRPRYTAAAPHPQLKALFSRHDAEFARLLDRFAGYAGNLRRIPRDGAGLAPGEPFWDNGWIPPLDAISIYCLLALRNPATYLEIGSGNSTRFARRAIRDLGLRTRIVSIDPQPRAEIDELCDQVVRQPFEETDPGLYAGLEPDDVVFADNSHRSFQNSDVTVHFLELLPRLPVGVAVGQHDIFLPCDYPAEWTERHYNEQYLLAAFLLGGAAGYALTLPCYHASCTPELARRLDPVFAGQGLGGAPLLGVAFWMTRTG